MEINSKTLISITEANQNFSKIPHLVKEKGMAVIIKNNKPELIVINFNEYEEIMEAKRLRDQLINKTADKIIDENMKTFLELAK